MKHHWLAAALSLATTACGLNHPSTSGGSSPGELPHAPSSGSAHLSAAAVRSIRHALGLSGMAVGPHGATSPAANAYLGFVGDRLSLRGARLSQTPGSGPATPATDVLVIDADIVGLGAGPLEGPSHLRVQATRPQLSADPLAMEYAVQAQPTGFTDGGERLEGAALIALRTVIDLTRQTAANAGALSDDQAAFKDFSSERILLRSVSVRVQAEAPAVETIVFDAALIGGGGAGPVEGEAVLTVTAMRPELSVDPVARVYRVVLTRTPTE